MSSFCRHQFAIGNPESEIKNFFPEKARRNAFILMVWFNLLTEVPAIRNQVGDASCGFFFRVNRNLSHEFPLLLL